MQHERGGRAARAHGRHRKRQGRRGVEGATSARVVHHDDAAGGGGLDGGAQTGALQGCRWEGSEGKKLTHVGGRCEEHLTRTHVGQQAGDAFLREAEGEGQRAVVAALEHAHASVDEAQFRQAVPLEKREQRSGEEDNRFACGGGEAAVGMREVWGVAVVERRGRVRSRLLGRRGLFVFRRCGLLSPVAERATSCSVGNPSIIPKKDLTVVMNSSCREKMVSYRPLFLGE